jgi:hypothetical protein
MQKLTGIAFIVGSLLFRGQPSARTTRTAGCRSPVETTFPSFLDVRFQEVQIGDGREGCGEEEGGVYVLFGPYVLTWVAIGVSLIRGVPPAGATSG